MKKVRLLAVCSALLAMFAWPWQSASEAKTKSVNCVNDATKDQSKIDRALKKLKAGNTLILTGTCKANLTGIPGGVTIDGGGTGACGEVSGATIEAADETQNTVTLTRSENVTIQGLIIKGGNRGVHLTGGAEGTIRDNNIVDNSDDGILLNRQSHARIANNCIESNDKDGIGVNSNSTAHIGFISRNTSSPNTIKNNGRDGVHVARSSNARILCNDISKNGRSGIWLHGIAHADIASNTINGNAVDGVRARESSGVNLGRLPFNSCNTDFADEANETTILNGGFGINCHWQGYVRGKRGSLADVSGATSFQFGCRDVTDP